MEAEQRPGGIPDDEWRVEARLGDRHGPSLFQRLRSLDLDDEVRERLGEKVIVTRDGPHLFLYARDEAAAREARRVIEELMAAEGFEGTTSITRWHPLEEAWKDPSVPLPSSESERIAERERHRAEEERHTAESGRYGWEVQVELPTHATMSELAERLSAQGFAVRRRWRYLLVGAASESEAHTIEGQVREMAPETAEVAVRVHPAETSHPVFIGLGSLKPEFLRDLGL